MAWGAQGLPKSQGSPKLTKGTEGLPGRGGGTDLSAQHTSGHKTDAKRQHLEARNWMLWGVTECLGRFSTQSTAVTVGPGAVWNGYSQQSQRLFPWYRHRPSLRW